MDTHMDADLDEHTARLVAQLHLDDLHELLDATGRRSPSCSDDFARALAIYENELQPVADRAMAQSMARAVRADAEIIKRALAEEQQACEDRRMALEAEHGAAAPAAGVLLIEGAAAAHDEDIDDDLLDKMCCIYMGDGKEVDTEPEDDDIYNDDSDPANAVLPSTAVTTTTKTKKKHVAMRRCCACSNDVPFYDTARAPCGHDYCRGCLQELFTLSLTDETLYPPRCCAQPIPADKSRLFLPAPLLGQFLARRLEMDTPDRTYCHVPHCSRFIPPQFLEHQIGYCVACNARSCTICKAAAHVGDCPDDPATRILDAVAVENGWKRCNGCRRLIELREGCNHITCPCGTQFCYLCGSRWKTCTCIVYTEEQLLRREHVVAARDARAGREVNQARIRQQILENHECNMHSWRWVRGAHRCDQCFKVLPEYIFECRHCRLSACNRCRRNRL